MIEHMKNMSSRLLRSGATVAALSAAILLQAQRTLYWTGASGHWNDAAHWSPGPDGPGGAGVPRTGDAVVIAAPHGAVQVFITDDAACGDLRVDASRNAVTVEGEERHHLEVAGDWHMTAGVRWSFDGEVVLRASTGATLDPHGAVINGDLRIDGEGPFDLMGALVLADDAELVLQRGLLRTNDRVLQVGGLRAQGRGEHRLEAGGSIVLARTLDAPGLRGCVDPGSSTLLVAGAPARWDGTAIDADEFARARTNCGTGAGQTPFTVNAVVTSNYNGFGVSCNGACDGAVTVQITGGIGPFNIQWSTGPTTANWSPVCAGNKLVIVTDAGQGVGCFSSVLVTPPPPLGVIFFGLNPPTCADVCNGTAITFPGGGTGFGYTYDWNGGVEADQNPTQLCAGLNTLHLTDANNCQYDTAFTIALLPLSAVLTTANASCFGDCNGTAGVQVSGGVPPYGYDWEPGSPAGDGTPDVTGLCAGSYTVLVTDANGCDTTLAFTITQPSPITPNPTFTNASCFGTCDGSASVAPAGAVGPYSFDWSPDPIAGDGTANATGLCAGTYAVLITDQASGCDTTISITIVSPPAIDVQLTTTDAVCNGDCNGTAEVSISGGTPGYAITWAPGTIAGQGTPNATGLCAGSYTVNVTDAAGCDTTIAFTIDEPAPILPNEAHTDITCAGACDGTATVAPTGGTPALTVVWSPAPPVGQNTTTASQLCAGVWSATITDASGCDTTVSITILEPPPLALTPAHTDVTCGNSCDGTASVDVAGGTPGYTYQWSPAPAIGQGTDSISGLCAGTYTVLVTDANGCTASLGITVLDAVPLQFSLQVNDATCPDACDGSAGVIVSGGQPNYSYDWEPGTPAGEGTANVTALCAGAYTLTVTDALGCDSTIAFTIDAPQAIVPNATVTNSTCNGDCDGSIVLAPTGGTGAYTYAWVPVPPNGDGTASATSLCPGVWNVTIASGACDTTLSFTITGPPPFDVPLSATNETCAGACDGTATLGTIGGGTPGYTIAWSPAPGGGQGTSNATGLCPGAYTVTITDAASCDTTLAFTIDPASPIDPQLVTTLASCGGGCDATASVAAGYASYDWAPDPIAGDGTPSVTGLCPGIYTVTIASGAGCDTTIQVLILTPSGIDATAFVQDASCADVCNGAVYVTVDIINPPYTFDWTPDPPGGDGNANATDLCAGTYILQITDGSGCDTLITYTVGSPSAIVPNATITNETCNGPCDGSATFAPTGGAAGYTFFWTPVPPEGQGTPIANDLCPGAYSVLITDAGGCDTLVTFDILPLDPVDAQLTTTDVICNGACDGTATVNPIGGTPAYTITWVPDPPLGQGTTTASGLCAGNWSVTVADANGCDTTIAFTIIEPTAIAPVLTTTGEDCTGPCTGTAHADVTGGGGTYLYDWTPDPINGDGTADATGLCAGTAYSLTITDASGCDTTIDLTIAPYNAIVPNLGSVPASCNGSCDGSATVGPTGGTPPYSYDWTPDPPGGDLAPQATGLCAGVWSVTITDSLGCDTVITVLITEPDPIVDNAVAVGVSCNGGSDGNISVAPTGGTPNYTYFWTPVPVNGQGNPFAAGFGAGTVTLLITDNNGCDSLFTYDLTEPPPLVVNADATPSQCQVCIGTISVHTSGGQAPYTFFVSSPDTVFATTDSVYTGLCAGLFTIQVNDANSCVAQLVVPIVDSDAEVLSMTDGSVQCPTDCNGSVNVAFTCSDPPCTLTWFDGAGVDLGLSTNTLTNLCPGDYLAQVTNASGCISMDTASVVAPDPIVANLSSTPVTCPGSCDGTATVGPTGGQPPYSYDWDPDPPGGDGTPQAVGLCEGTYAVTIGDALGCSISASVLIVGPQPIAAAPSITDVTCAGDCNGSIALAVSGGTAGYSFDWSPDPAGGDGTSTATALCPGDWTVVITDANGCTASFTYTLASPAPLVLNTSSTDSQCALCNGTATVVVGGGLPPYTIAWTAAGGVPAGSTSTITDLCAGIYTVSVIDALGCTATAQVPVSDSDGETLTVTDGSTTCANNCDGAVSVNFSCGVPSCSIAWTDAIGNTIGTGNALTDLCSGSYLVQVTNGDGCISIDTALVTPSQILLPTITSIPVSCAGDCDGVATAGVGGGVPPYTFDWTPDPPGGDGAPQATGLCAGVYTVAIQDFTGCDTVVSVLITGPAPLTATTVVSDASCAGSCNGSIVMTVSGGTPGYTYDWTPDPPGGDGTNAAFGLCAGSYDVQVTDLNGCTTVLTWTVNEPTPLALDLSTVPSECGACIGEAGVLVSGGTPPYGYAWTNSGGVTVSTDSAVTGLCSGFYVLIVTDAQGCSAQLGVPITDSNGEVLSTENGTTTCPSSCDGTVAVDFVCNDPACSIAWSDALGNDLGESGNSLDSLCGGTYFVTVTNGSGCITIDTALVVPPLPITTNLSTTPVTCNGACDGTATAGATGGSGTTYAYDWGPDPIAGDGTPQVTGLCAGVYTLQITDSLGCDTTVSVLILEPTLFSVAAAITDVVCNGDCDGSIALTVGGATPGYTFDWSPDPITGDGTNSVSGLCAGDHTVLIADANGCDTVITYTIMQPAALAVDLTTTDNICFGDCSGTASVDVSGGSSPYSITWLTAGGTVIASGIDSLGGLCGGDYLLHVVDANGCVNDVPFTIGQGVPFDAGLIFTGETCLGPCDGTASIVPTGGSGTISITWTDPGGTIYATDTVQVSGLCSGTWSVTLADTLGCDSTFLFSVLPYAPIVPDENVTNVSCFGACDGEIVLNASGGIGSLSYAWTPVPPNGDGTTTASDLCPGPWGVTITDAVGCDTTLAFIITEPPELLITVDAVIDASCATANDGSIAIAITGGQPGYLVTWSGPGGFSSNDEDIAALFPGPYTVIVTDAGGCSATANASVAALSTIVADAGADTVFCAGDPVVLDGSGTVGATGFAWADASSNTVGTSEVVTLTGLPPGTHVFTLTASDPPCSATDQVSITVLPLPVADAGPDVTIFIGDEATLGGAPTGPPGSSYSWSPDSLLNDPAVANPQASPAQSTWFTVLVTGPNGCSALDSVFVEVVPDVVIPSGFTPNGDGWNDTWQIDFIDLFPACEVEIYNRWGELLFSSVGYGTPWDGTYKGGYVPVGTYYYVVKLNDPDFPEPYTGPLTVLR